MIQDTSSPSAPALVLQTGERQWGIFKPTGGLVAYYTFECDAADHAESLFDYVRYGVARPYGDMLVATGRGGHLTAKVENGTSYYWYGG